MQQRFPGWTTDYSECVPSPQAGHDVCWAEVHDGVRYQQVEIGIDRSTSSPFPSAATTHPEWTRAPIRVAYSAGTGIANSPVYDWKLLIQRAAPGATIVALDGSTVGYPVPLFTFHCAGTSKRITCRNLVGDKLTYTPAGSL